MDSQYFDINSTNGALSIKQVIDSDGPAGRSSLTDLTLVVRDSAGLSASADLVFTITDVNDNAPQCSKDVYTVELTENTPAGEM